MSEDSTSAEKCDVCGRGGQDYVFYVLRGNIYREPYDSMSLMMKICALCAYAMRTPEFFKRLEGET